MKFEQQIVDNELISVELPGLEPFNLKPKAYMTSIRHFEHILQLGDLSYAARKAADIEKVSIDVLSGFDLNESAEQLRQYFVDDPNNEKDWMLPLLESVMASEQNIIKSHFASQFFVAGFQWLDNENKDKQKWDIPLFPPNSLLLLLPLEDLSVEYLDKTTTDRLKHYGYCFNDAKHPRVQELQPLLDFFELDGTELRAELKAGQGYLFDHMEYLHKFNVNEKSKCLIFYLIPNVLPWDIMYPQAKPVRDQVMVQGLAPEIFKLYPYLRNSEDVYLVAQNAEIDNWNSAKNELHNIFDEPEVVDELLACLQRALPKLPILPRSEFLGLVKQQLSIKSYTESARWNRANKIFDQAFETEKDTYKRYSINRPMIFWPNPQHAKIPRDIYDEIPIVNTFPIVTKSTKIGSAGSCFAAEIAKYLQQKDFNYVVTEKVPDPSSGMYFDMYDHNDPYSPFCAQYGILFNTPSFTQLAEKAFETRAFRKILVRASNAGSYLDPYRESVFFTSTQAYLDDYENHRTAIKQALTECEVFVLTLGLNEAWQLSDGTFASRNPRQNTSHLFKHRVLTVQENIDYLQRFYDIVKQHNPNIKLIVSVSPVPFMATGRGETHHVVTANTHSKAVLRVAAEDFCNSHDDVFYFPSYEMVTQCIKEPWQGDLRHVTPEAVKKVMNLFEKMFVISENG